MRWIKENVIFISRHKGSTYIDLHFLKRRVVIESNHKAADAFWQCWEENGIRSWRKADADKGIEMNTQECRDREQLAKSLEDHGWNEAAEIVRAFGVLERLCNQGNDIQIWRASELWHLCVGYEDTADDYAASTILEAIQASTNHE